MILFDLIGALAEFWFSPRFYLCLLIAAGIVYLLYLKFPDQEWVLIVSVLVMIAGIALGLWWEIASKPKN